jgi:four helix bundle protein
VKNYRDLEIYKLSYELAISVHQMSLSLDKYELYEEGSQIRRASKGITACIVEGYGRRRYKAEFVKYLVYAHASCDETIVHLQFIKDAHKKLEGECLRLIEAYNELGSKINKFIQYVESEWNKTRNP